MIKSLTVSGLAVIGDVELDLDAGLTALTGETGTGKTMLLHAISLLRGQKADVARLAPGASEMSIEAVFELPSAAASPQLWQALGDMDAAVDGNELIVRRVVKAEGRASASVGGRAVPTTLLAEITDRLIAVHGQHSARLLAKTETHRRLLDAYAGAEHAALLDQCASAHKDFLQLTGAVEKAQASSQSDLLLLESMQALVLAADELRATRGEDQVLREQAIAAHELLAQRESLLQALGLLAGVGDETSNAAMLLAQAERILGQAGEIAASARELVRNSATHAREAASELLQLVGGDEEHAAETERIEQRRAVLASVVRRFNASTLDDFLDRADAARTYISTSGQAADLNELQRLRDEADARSHSLAALVSESRHAAALRLSAAVNVELSALGFTFAGFTVNTQPAARTAHGADLVDFQLATRPTAAAVSLAAGASGGEMSRVSLALTVVLSASEHMPAMIFDEVDAGIGGNTAHAVASKLADLAERTQVIVVTHLPQVASIASAQWVVSANPGGSTVTRVSDNGRVVEICRMMGTDPSDPAAVEVAHSLLSRASGAHLNSQTLLDSPL